MGVCAADAESADAGSLGLPIRLPLFALAIYEKWAIPKIELRIRGLKMERSR